MQSKRTPGVPRPEAYTAPVSPLIPVAPRPPRSAPTIRPGAYTDPVSPLIPTTPPPATTRSVVDGTLLLMVVWGLGFLAFGALAAVGTGLPLLVWLLVGAAVTGWRAAP
jgi:hypothetical protein